MKNLLAMCSLMVLGACSSSDPLALIPPTERALIASDSRRQAQARPISVAQLLSQASQVSDAKPAAQRSAPPLRITLRFKGNDVAVSDVDLERVRQAMKRTGPDSSVPIRVVAGPSASADDLSAALVARRRVTAVIEGLGAAEVPIEPGYDPSLAANQVVITFGRDSQS